MKHEECFADAIEKIRNENISYCYTFEEESAHVEHRITLVLDLCVHSVENGDGARCRRALAPPADDHGSRLLL